ncbi:hypothetical protein C3941_13710 [Kaistia algarum]|uniref:hypothetical protein n=1 Tax=Kaistia algarum TaxID=2083279 RepID=UPI000CE91A9B|nr:hypothetical protein [Kaistia algarum]MCX5513728.1 hypothetical protein [Kaistia algarum]PPE79400.1 hypothetical protein C3941_13710 [Kaistia algarum]
MTDAFASYSLGLDSPFVRTVPLTDQLGEFPPTRAVWVNVGGVLTAVFAENESPVLLDLRGEEATIRHFRIKRVVSFNSAPDEAGENLLLDTDWPALVGLY